jgi:Cu-processing system ATP-binding protein
MTTLTLKQVSKTFEGAKALSEVSLTVAPGERVALLGHNGAGKSTLMKIALGLIPADSGHTDILGAAPGSHAAREATAYLPENAAFHPALSGEEQLGLYLRWRGLSPSLAKDLLAQVGLKDAAHRRIGTYSKGMRQRVGLAQALIGNPKLMILDEPTSGLDPVSRREFYAILDDLAASGVAILLSSHALTEVEARTDRIAILSNGVLVANDTVSALRRAAGLPITIHVQARAGEVDTVARAISGSRVNGTGVNLVCAPSDKLARLADIAGLGEMISDVDVIPPSLEEIYTHFGRRADQ